MSSTDNIPLLTELDSICRVSAINISLLKELPARERNVGVIFQAYRPLIFSRSPQLHPRFRTGGANRGYEKQVIGNG
jgi:hypothetical protein